MDVLQEALRRVAARERVVLVTVIRTAGSTPRKEGARMLVGEKGLLAGTVGGGRFEQEILKRAAEILPKGGFATAEIKLTLELGQCCGGEMEVSLEVLKPAERLFIFGAGHVAKELAPAAKRVGFEVTVLDDRDGFLTRERFPEADRLVDACDPAGWPDSVAIDGGTWCVVMTHDHGLDQRIVEKLVASPARFVGLIGSRSKARRFAARLAAWGATPEQVARLRSPVGIEIGAETPQEIAVSIVAELVAERRKARSAQEPTLSTDRSPTLRAGASRRRRA